MDTASARRLAQWLERADVTAFDPERVAALRAALDRADPPSTAGRGGAVIGYDPAAPRRRLVEFDRRGALVAAYRWALDGGLLRAKCLSADGAWIGIEPGAASHPAWGVSDRLWRRRAGEAWAPDQPVTLFQALDYQRLDFIPPLSEPARLPPGAGTAVLNALAGLMKDQGVARVRYRGPYPTEQLFTALLECFRYDLATDDPLGRFMDGGLLDWLPAPHERHATAPGVVVQLRHGIDKVVVDGVAFYRRDWQGVIRREPRIVREVGDRVVCSLWAFDRAVEDRLALDRTGEVLDRPAPAPDPHPPAPLAPVWKPALAGLIARDSAPPLAAPLREVVDGLDLEWGAVVGDLLRVEGKTARLSRRLREAALGWIAEAPSGAERGERAIAFALEVARLLAPAARLRAQAALLEMDADAQARSLEALDPAPVALPQAVGKLLTLIARGSA